MAFEENTAETTEQVLTEQNTAQNSENNTQATTPPAAETDWRADLAGGDEKLRNFLGKYATQAAFAVDAKKKNDELLRRAGMKLPENPTDEEMAAFRKEQGIPDAPAGYLESLPDGLVVGDDDRPYVDKFIEAMHGANAPKAAVDAALSAYYRIVDEQNQAAMEVDSQARDASDASLRDEWGGDYKRNMNVVNAYLGTLPQTIQEALKNARTDDGVSLGNNAEVIKWVASLALEANPHATVVPGIGQTAVNQIQDEIDAIKKIIGTKEYRNDPSKANRLQELLAAQIKMKSS